MRLHVLGPARLVVGDEQRPLVPDQLLWLSALLAVRGSALSREVVMASLWPDAAPDTARNRLRQLLHRARRSPIGAGLGADAVLLRWQGSSDVAEFTLLAERAEWQEAVSAYGGLLLDGIPAAPSEELESWLHVERERLHALHVRAILEAAQRHEGRGDLRSASLLLERAVGAEPLSSELVTRLTHMLGALGELSRAEQVLQRHREALAREVGSGAAADLDALARQLRAAAESQAVQDRGLPSQPTVRGLPTDLTTFVGRQRELEALLDRLCDPATRWVTLVGAGGAGKTRLAGETARRAAARFTDGAVFVPLASLPSSDLLESAVLDALGGRGEGSTAAQRPADVIGPRRMLLVLDNFEHLLEGADVLPDLLAACPNLTLLVTSRQRLNFQAEWVVRVDGLDYPEAAELPGRGSPSPTDVEGSGAVRLFAERAARTGADLDTTRDADAVLRVVRRCEGLPLAIELAAAWTADLDVRAVADRLERDWDFLVTALRDVPVRHRSLRVVFEASWQQLAPRLRDHWAALSVLRTPFDHATARHVAGAEPHDLRDLERRSLLRPLSDDLFVWHENLRQYAAEKLAESELPTPRDIPGLHLDFFRDLALREAPRLRGGQQTQALVTLAARHDDLRAALEHANRSGDAASGLKLAGALHWFWYVRGHHEEGQTWLDQFLDHPGPLDAARVRALASSGALRVERAMFGGARARYDEALWGARALGDERAEAEVLHLLGVMERDLGHLDEAEPRLLASAEFSERHGETYALGTTLNDLGIVRALRGDDDGAAALFRRSLDLKRRAGDLQGVAYALGNLGAVTSDPEAQLKFYEDSLVIKRELGDVQGLATTVFNCGRLAARLGREQEARRHLRETLTLLCRLGKYTRLPNVLLELAQLEHDVGDPARGAVLLGAATALELRTGVPLDPKTQAMARELDRHLRSTPTADLDALLRSGAELTAQDAVEFALGSGEPGRTEPTSAVTSGH